jgi:hypothetical protein
MNPIIKPLWTPEERVRYGIRGIDDFTAEELARLQQKVEDWVRQRAPRSVRHRHQSTFVMKSRTTAPASGATPQGVGVGQRQRKETT